MNQFTCKDHPGMPYPHDDCEGDGVSWTTVPLKTTLSPMGLHSWGELNDVIHDALLAHKLVAALKAVESDDSDFLGYIAGELASFPCMCEQGAHADTPPSFWPELVACIAKRAAKDAINKAVDLLQAEKSYWMAHDADEIQDATKCRTEDAESIEMAAGVAGGALANVIVALSMGTSTEEYLKQISVRDNQLMKLATGQFKRYPEDPIPY